ncbi:MAG: translocation/assembly module TamB domain-containing protein [Acidobacteriia bacterium]|nr:translocation/assembly module TamB domain-containing protein [Terriglobia bacterium]
MLLIALAAGLVTYLSGPGARLDALALRRVRDGASAAFERPVSVASVHVSVLSGRIEIRGLTLSASPPAARPVLTIPVLSATLALRPLLQGRLEISGMRIERPEVNVWREDGRWEGPFPASAGEERRTAILLSRLEIVDGVVSVEDREIPLWGRAEEVRIAWVSRRDGDGEGTLDTNRLSVGDGDAKQLGKVHLEAALTGKKAKSKGAVSLGGSVLNLEGDADLDLRGTPTVSGEIRAAFDVPRAAEVPLIPSLLGLGGPIAGSLRGTATVRFGSEGWAAEGRVRGDHLAYSGIEASALDAEVAASERGATIRSLSARMLGGTVTAAGSVELRRGGDIRAKVGAEGLSVNDALKVAGLDAALDGVASLDADLSGSLGDRGSLRGTGTFRVMPTGTAGARRRLDAEATGTIGLEHLVISAIAPAARVGPTTASIRAEKALDGPKVRLHLDIVSGALGESADLVAALFGHAPGESPLPLDSARLEGRGKATAELTIEEGHHASGTIAFVVDDIAYLGVGADSAAGTLEVEGGVLTFRDTRASKGSGTFRLKEGTAPTSAGEPWHFAGSFDAWPADDVLARTGAPGSPTARITGRAEIGGGSGGRHGSSDLSLSDAKLGPIAFETGRVEAVLEESVLKITSLAVRGPAGRVAASGSYDFANSRIAGSLEASGVDASLAGPWLRGLPVAGRVAFSLRGETGSGTTAWSGTLSPDPDLSLGGRPVEDLSVSSEGDGASARLTVRIGNTATALAEVAIAPPHDSKGQLELTSVPVAWLVEFIHPAAASSVGGELTGRIKWSGPLDDPGAIRADAEIHPLRVVVGAESFTAPRPARVSLEGGRISFDDVSLVSGASRIEVRGGYPLDPSRAALDLSLDASADLSALTAFVRGLTSAGTLTVALKATGSPTTPDLQGTARLEGGRVRMAGNPLAAADRLQAEARIERGAVRIERFSGTVAGGSLHGTGLVTLEGLEPASLVLEAKVNAAAPEIPEGFRGLYSGDLRFEAAKGKDPALSGRLDLIRGVWRRNFELDRINLLARTRAPVVEVPKPDEGLARTSLDVTVDANDNLWLRNDLADTEAWGRIEIGGTVGHPQVSGHCESLDGGELRFGKVRYQLESARVDIPAGPRLNPEFDIVASTRVREYDVRMHLWGDTTRVDSELSSNPSLAERDILALLLTGSTTDTADYQAKPGTIEGSAASLVGGQIGSMVGSQLERWLGFEEVRIDPYQYQTTGDPTTRITLGKRLFPRVFVRTSVPLNSTTQTTTYEVEYQVNRKVKASAFRTDRDALGAGARYSGKTWSHYARTRRKATTPASPHAEEKVSEVRFLGDPGGDTAQLARLVPVRTGRDFSRRDLVEGTLKLKKHYVKDGYLEASVTASSASPRAGFVDVEYAIDRGPKIELVIEGAGDSEKTVRGILDALWLEPASTGTDLEEEARERIRPALQAEGYFKCEVRVDAESTSSGRKVTFHVDRGEKVHVASLSIAGASSIPEAEILQHVLAGRETRFRRDVLKPEVLDIDVSTVENLYHSRGFLSARAAWSVALTPDGRDAHVEIQVTEGPRATLHSVRISGNREIGDDRLRALVRSREGEPFDAAKVYEDLERMRSIYDEGGYLDARVEDDVRSDGESVDLVYVIVEGERKTLRDVEIEGNRITRTSVIRRLVHLAPGDPISHAQLQKMQTDLSRTGLFSEVRLSWADAQGPPGGQVLKISVREADDLALGAGAAYDTFNGPSVQVDAADTNLRGTGWYSGLSILYGSKVQRQQLNFRAPRAVAGWVPILSATHDVEVRDSFSQTGTAVSVALERKTPGDVTHIVRYTTSFSNVYALTVPEETFHATEPRLDLGQVRLSSVGYSIARDKRDNPLNTTRGTYASADLRVFAEPIGSQQRFSKLFLQGSAARPLPGDLVGASAVKIGLASRLGTPNPLPLQERYFAGGGSTFRGFRQDGVGYVDLEQATDSSGNPVQVDAGTLEHGTLRPLGGESVFILSNELRRRVAGSISAVLFWDSGSVFPTPADIRLDRFRNTLGTGIRFDTPIGPVRIEFGWKLDPRAGESAGEYVFTIGQSF